MIAAIENNLSTGAPVKLKRPMLDIWGAMACLDCSEDCVLNLIDSGAVQWAFNIAGKRSRVRCVRLLAANVSEYAQGLKVDRGFDQVVELLFKHHRPLLRASELFAALHCSSRHLLSLIRDGSFGSAARTQCRVQTGQRQSPTVPREAVLDWLKRRRLP